jgi:hypothetical protein
MWAFQKPTGLKMSYGKETTCMKLWCVIATSMILMSCAALSASSVTLERTSHLLRDSAVIDQAVDTEVASTSYMGGVTRALRRCVKTGLKLVRNHPLKALTIFLSLQNNASSIRPPSASGFIVLARVNETRTYDSTNPNPELLGPIEVYNIGSDVPPICNVTVTLLDLAAGTLTSSGTGITQKFVNGVWSASGNITKLDPFVDKLSVKITSGFNRSFSLYAELFDITAPTKKIQGTVQVVPCTVREIFPDGAILPLSVVMRANETAPAFFNPETVLSALSNATTTGSASPWENCIISAEYKFVSRSLSSSVTFLLESFRRSIVPTAILLDEDTAREFVASNSSFVAVHKVKARLGADFKTCCQESYSQCCPQYLNILPKILALNPMLSSPQTQPSTSILDSQVDTKMTDSVHESSLPIVAPSDQGQETTMLLSESESSKILFIMPSDENYGAIIGGVVGAGLFLGSVIGIAVAVKKGLCTRKEETTSQEELPKEAILENMNRAAVQGQPQYATSPSSIQSSQNTYSTLPKAAQDGACDLIEVHLNLGCQIDELNDDGYTPLHLAAREGHLDACKFLIAKGAHKTLTSKDGKTASQLAQERGYNNIVLFLEQDLYYQDLPVSPISNGYGKLSSQEGLSKPATKNHYANTVQIVENAKPVYSNLEGHEI